MAPRLWAKAQPACGVAAPGKQASDRSIAADRTWRWQARRRSACVSTTCTLSRAMAKLSAASTAFLMKPGRAMDSDRDKHLFHSNGVQTLSLCSAVGVPRPDRTLVCLCLLFCAIQLFSPPRKKEDGDSTQHTSTAGSPGGGCSATAPPVSSKSSASSCRSTPAVSSLGGRWHSQMRSRRLGSGGGKCSATVMRRCMASSISCGLQGHHNQPRGVTFSRQT